MRFRVLLWGIFEGRPNKPECTLSTVLHRFWGQVFLVCDSRTLLTGSSASRPLGVNSEVGLVLTGILILKTVQKQGLRLNRFILPIYKDKI